MISQYTKLAKVEPIADVGFDFFAKAAQYKSEKIQQSRGILQSTLAGFVNNVDILKEDDRQYFNEKVKNVVDNLNNFKDVDLSDPNTAYQLQSMLGEVKQDGRVLTSILDTSNFRNVQKQINVMRTNPKFAKLLNPKLNAWDEKKMQEYINTPGARFELQNASIDPDVESQLEVGYKSIVERKQVDVIGENIVTKNIKDWNLLYGNGQEVANKNAQHFAKTYEVDFDFESNPRQAIKGVSNMLEVQENFYKNKKTELEAALTTTNDPSKYKDAIQAYQDKINEVAANRKLVEEGKDLGSIKNIGFSAYLQNTAIQQASKGYSYISKVEMSKQAQLEQQAKLMGLKLGLENQMDIAADDRRFQRELALKQLDVQGDVTVAGIRKSKDGSTSSTSPMSDVLGGNLLQTVVQDTKGQETNWYSKNSNDLRGLQNDALKLQQDLVKIMVEQSNSNPKVKQMLEKYPDLGTKLYGEKALKSILSTADMLSSLSGSKLDNGATAEGAMKIMNQIKEKNVLYNLKAIEDKNIKKLGGKDESSYNKLYNKLNASTIIRRDIPLNMLNNLDKDTKPLFNALIPDITKGSILTKEGKVFDNSLSGSNKGKDILKNIDWEKSEKGSFNIDNLTLEVIPKNSKGESISDEPVLIKLTSEFVSKLRLLGWNDTIEKINKPNTEIDFYVKKPNNAEAVKAISQHSFYIDSNKSPNLPKGTVLEYNITNVKDPIPSAGRNDYSYDVNLNIKGKPYTFSVNSTAEIHSKIDMFANAAKQQALDKFTKENKQPTAKQLEQTTFDIFIELLTRIK